ncbi:MAG: hypothetical protein GX868_01270 [Actinobacteria bacterium]|nr:hypothetical protein [Actinomycetota bacterium]
MFNRRNAASTALVVLIATGLAGCSGSDGDTATAQPESTDATASDDAATGEFTLLSYNVAGLPVEISSVRPDLHIPLISPRLNVYDVVATQEDFDWWSGFAGQLDFVNYHDRLRAETNHTFRTDAHPGPAAVGLDLTKRMEPLVGDGLGVISRFALENTVRVPWTSCFGGLDTSDEGAADCASMKGFLLTDLTLPNGSSVHLYNLHGEAGSSVRDQELQVDNYRQLAEYIAAHSAGAAVIVAGDTNLHTHSDHRDASDGADTEIWTAFLEATGLVDACDATRCEQPDAIDKVAVRSGNVALEVTDHAFVSDEFLDETGENLSDHPPLAVTIRWSPVR